MSAEISINVSQLQALALEVQTTKRPRTIDLGSDVVAVLKPAIKRRGKRAQSGVVARPKMSTSTLEWERALMRLPTPLHLSDEDIDGLIDEAKEEQAIRSHPGGIIAATAGRFKADQPTRSAEELRVLAEEAIAADVVDRS
jgi:hypothetical protein